jgi:hypothetical protein
VTECAGLLKDKAAYYALQGYSGIASYCSEAAVTIQHYSKENNYEHAKAALDGSISTIALAVPVNGGG